MPLNLGRRRNASSDDNYIPTVRYAARDNVWSTWDDVTKETVKVEFFATVDLPNIRTGWLKFAAGEPPDFLWDGADGKAQPRPGKDHRRGFSVNLVLEGHGVRELCSNSAGLCAAISDAFEFERASDSKQGLLPVLGTTPATRVEAPTVDYFEPHFQIAGWEPRPAELPIARPGAAASPAASSTRSTAVVPRIEDTLADDEIPY
jgi:hypothetical protein